MYYILALVSFGVYFCLTPIGLWFIGYSDKWVYLQKIKNIIVWKATRLLNMIIVSGILAITIFLPLLFESDMSVLLKRSPDMFLFFWLLLCLNLVLVLGILVVLVSLAMSVLGKRVTEVESEF